MLIGGGVAYTLGVPVLCAHPVTRTLGIGPRRRASPTDREPFGSRSDSVRNRNLDHVLWHAFVLAGSGIHYAALLQVVTAALRGTI